MNWEAIGAIGELIGALAVVLTLVYLSIQLRQNTRAVDRSMERAVWEDASTWMYKLIDDPEIAELYRAGIQDNDLPVNDRMRFRLLMTSLFSHWNLAFKSEAFFIIRNSDIRDVLSQPGGARYWRNSSSREDVNYDPDFMVFMNKIVREIEDESGGNT